MKMLIKNFGIYFIFAIIVLGCNESNVEKQNTGYILNKSGKTVKIIEVDSCEYLYYVAESRVALAHKGNCKFCEERRKSDCE